MSRNKEEDYIERKKQLEKEKAREGFGVITYHLWGEIKKVKL